MKPCAQNRKLIVWLTLNSLDAQQTRRLQAHLETCEGCRRYLAEISKVTKRLAEQENLDIQASESFHRKVAGRLRTVKPDSIWEILAAYLALLNWRVAFPVVAALVLVCVTVAILRQQPPEIVSSPRPSIRTALVSSADNDLAPSIANYQRVANQSLAKLDALLTRQGNRPLPPMPIYTASSFGLANESF
jgi:anti-sigma factor RsiW